MTSLVLFVVSTIALGADPDVKAANDVMQASKAGDQTLPSPWYLQDDVQYFPPGPQFPLSKEAAAQNAVDAEATCAKLFVGNATAVSTGTNAVSSKLCFVGLDGLSIQWETKTPGRYDSKKLVIPFNPQLRAWGRLSVEADERTRASRRRVLSDNRNCRGRRTGAGHAGTLRDPRSTSGTKTSMQCSAAGRLRRRFICPIPNSEIRCSRV